MGCYSFGCKAIMIIYIYIEFKALEQTDHNIKFRIES
jgi:hypothetical protein